MVGASKYGPRLSGKKPIFISDPPKTTTMINQPTSEEEEKKDNTSNNNGDDMKLEPRSAAFVSNQPSRISQQQEQEQEQEQEQQQQPLQQSQQQQPAVVYPYSVKIEQAANGSAKVSIHTYNDDPDKARYESIRLFIQTREELKSKGIKVLEA